MVPFLYNTIPYRHGTIQTWHCIDMVPYRHGTIQTWYHIDMVPYRHGTIQTWYHIDMVPYRCGTIQTWYHIDIVLFRYGTIQKWQYNMISQIHDNIGHNPLGVYCFLFKKRKHTSTEGINIFSILISDICNKLLRLFGTISIWYHFYIIPFHIDMVPYRHSTIQIWNNIEMVTQPDIMDT